MFVIKTPNPHYCGSTHGVKFTDGTAVVESEELRNILVNDYGYITVEETEPEEVAEVKPARQRKSSGK